MGSVGSAGCEVVDEAVLDIDVVEVIFRDIVDIVVGGRVTLVVVFPNGGLLTLVVPGALVALVVVFTNGGLVTLAELVVVFPKEVVGILGALVVVFPTGILVGLVALVVVFTNDGELVLVVVVPVVVFRLTLVVVGIGIVVVLPNGGAPGQVGAVPLGAAVVYIVLVAKIVVVRKTGLQSSRFPIPTTLPQRRHWASPHKETIRMLTRRTDGNEWMVPQGLSS